MLVSPPVAQLPPLALTRGVLPLAWALVLGSLVAMLSQRLAKSARRAWVAAIVIGVAATGLVSPSYSPGYWLGLAYQIPSLSSLLLCAAYLSRQLMRPRLSLPAPATPHAGIGLPLPFPLRLAGAVLGWILLGDTLAWWPVSIYAWGFGNAACFAALVLSLAWWVFFNRHLSLLASILLISVLLIFTFTRLPSGNLWDALLDPWLWIYLQFSCLRQGLRCVKAWYTTRRQSTTRA